MKRVIKCLLLLFAGFMMLDVYASDKTIFTVKGIEASAGNEVTITINMANNPKYELLSMKLPIDTTQVDFLECGINGFDQAMLKECSLNPKNELIFYALTMYTEENKLMGDTGDILYIKLKIKDDVKKDIPLSLTVTDYGKNENEPLPFDVVNGMIKISGDIETTIIDQKEDLSKDVNKNSQGDVTWKSSDQEVAVVDKEGTVEFKKSGNTTITAKDAKGRIVYEKTYLVNKELSKDYTIYKIIGVIAAILITSVIVIIFLRKNRMGKKVN